MNDRNVTDNVTDKRFAKIIDLIMENDTISTSQIAEELNVTKRTILRDISKLKTDNLITRSGDEKTGRWVIIKK